MYKNKVFLSNCIQFETKCKQTVWFPFEASVALFNSPPPPSTFSPSFPSSLSSASSEKLNKTDKNQVKNQVKGDKLGF